MFETVTRWPEPLRAALRQARGPLANAIGFSACISVLYLAPTLYMMQVYDRVVPTSGKWTLVWLTLLVALAIGTLSFLDNIRLRILTRLSLQLNRDLSGPLLNRVLDPGHDAGAAAAKGQALRDFDQVRQLIASPLALAVLDLPWSPVFLLVAFMIHPVLGMMIGVGGVVLVALAVTNERASRSSTVQTHRTLAHSYAIQADLAGKAELIRGLGMNRAAVALQQEAREAGLRDTIRMQLSGGFFSAWVKFVRMFLQSLALGVGAWLAIGGQISIGTIIAASVLLSRSLQPIEQLVGGWGQIAQARQSVLSLRAILDDADAKGGPRMHLPEPTGSLEAVNLSLRNPAGTAFVVRSVNLRFEPGTVTGIIGASAAGKSTLVRLLSGAIAPEVGEVRIEGASFADWDREDLAGHIGYMPQVPTLLPGTVADNISRFHFRRGGDRKEVEASVVRAAQLAGIHEFILRLPDSYATRLGTTEFALSGGQAQRVSLARAAYGDPHVLILDEPNAGLDAEGERALLRLMDSARQAGKVVVVVAHHPLVLNQADHLVVMADGAVERAGPREEILRELREAAARSNVVAMRREQ